MLNTREALIRCLQELSQHQITMRNEGPESVELWYVADDHQPDPDFWYGPMITERVVTIYGSDHIKLWVKNETPHLGLPTQLFVLFTSALKVDESLDGVDLKLRPNGSTIDIDVVGLVPDTYSDEEYPKPHPCIIGRFSLDPHRGLSARVS